MEDVVNIPFRSVYSGRRVLVTGHTGFKGSWLSLWLKQLGATVCGYSLPAPTEPSFYEVIRSFVFADEFIDDIRDADKIEAAIRTTKPDIIFHLAAQPLVRHSYAEPGETFEINALGTMRLIETVRRLHIPSIVIVVTSDKCYENRHWEYGYRETDSLGGHDVYSMSKAAAELVVQAWRRSFFQVDAGLGPLASARAGNVIGGGDYAMDRIVPDCVRALLAGEPIRVRNPLATRPWQHVLDCLSGYLWLGALLAQQDGKLSGLDDAFNFGPNAQSNQPVAVLVKEFLRHWPGEWRDQSDGKGVHEAHLLHLSTDKAARQLSWFPTWDFSKGVRETARWYRARHVERADMLGFSIAQIETFSTDAATRQIAWAAAA